MADSKTIQQLEAFFNQAEDLFLLFDANLFIVDVNAAFLKASQIEKELLIGKHLTQISPDVREKGRYEKYEEVLRTGEPLIVEEISPHPSLGVASTRIKAFKVGDGLGMIVTNITDLRGMIEELDNFTYKSSHDMRGPLANILGLINLSETAVHDLDTAFSYFEKIRSQALKLDEILIRIIETARIRQDDKQIHLISFEQLLDEVWGSCVTTPGFNNILLEKDISLTHKFYSDRRLLFSILQNLVDNAIKYQDQKEAHAFVKVTVKEHQNGVNIDVTDNGIGIAKNLQKDVFKIFFRGTSKVIGTGLGLYTVKNCVQKLNGQIQMESKENEGTSFHIYIPSEFVEHLAKNPSLVNA